MSKKNNILLLALFILSCASPTSYQQEVDSEGYSESKLSSTSYQISFKANKNSSKNRIYDFALLRGAQLTLNKGYFYFTVTKSETFINYKVIDISQEPWYDSSQYRITPDLFVTTKHTLKNNNICEMVDSNGNVLRVNMTGPLTNQYTQKMYYKHVATSPVTATYVQTEIRTDLKTQDWMNNPANWLTDQNRIRLEIPQVVTIIHFDEKKLNRFDSYDAKETIKRISEQYQIEL